MFLTPARAIVARHESGSTEGRRCQVAVNPVEAARRSRRSILSAAAGVGGALAVQALVRPTSVSAASVVLGATNNATAATTIRTTQATSTAVALKGLVATTGPGGATAGVWGQSNAQHGSGIFGFAPVGGSKGVWGRSVNGRGVFGEATGATGLNYGVYGESKSSGGVGVAGTGKVNGVAGSGATGIYGAGTTYGVYGSGSNTAVWGVGGTWGVYGSGVNGVEGHGSAYGVVGQGYFGVFGGGSSHGVIGQGGPYGVLGTGTTWAGLFEGNVRVTGTLSVPAGGSVIDHPESPGTRYLEQSFVESSERLTVYRGTVTLDGKGRSTVRLPRYAQRLTSDIGYQLTPIGAPAPALHVAQEVSGSSFRIAGGAPGQRVCWIVTGARQDPWARQHPMRVSRRKRSRDVGRYLHPDLVGLTASSAIDRFPDLERGRTRHPRKRPAGPRLRE
jgi:hypothetical protein